MTCHARQYSDQMLCRCGLAWDVNDPAPPGCRNAPNRGRYWPNSVVKRHIRHVIDDFIADCRRAGLRVRQIKMSIFEAHALRAQAPEAFDRGHYGGIQVRLTTTPRWQKEPT